jgi:hypothetical protein
MARSPTSYQGLACRRERAPIARSRVVVANADRQLWRRVIGFDLLNRVATLRRVWSAGLAHTRSTVAIIRTERRYVVRQEHHRRWLPEDLDVYYQVIAVDTSDRSEVTREGTSDDANEVTIRPSLHGTHNARSRSSGRVPIGSYVGDPRRRITDCHQRSANHSMPTIAVAAIGTVPNPTAAVELVSRMITQPPRTDDVAESAAVTSKMKGALNAATAKMMAGSVKITSQIHAPA